MLFNLGLTADAAAAHKHDFSPESSSTMPASEPSLSDLSFVRLPALRLGQFLNRARSPFSADVVEPPSPDVSPAPPVRGIAVESIPDTQAMSDGQVSTTDVVQSPARTESTSTRKLSRRKTSYQLAHPAGTARPKRLRLRPKLLLQVQRVSPVARPVPVVDVLPSTVYLPRSARKFPSIFRGKNGLGPNDLIVMISEFYQESGTPHGVHTSAASPENGDEQHREVVATICQLPQEDPRAGVRVEICLNHGPVWEGSRLPTGAYEFVARTEDGVRTLRWVSRSTKHRRPSSLQREESRRFTFSVIDPSTRRHPVIASMARNHLEVYDEYSIPSVLHPTPAPVSSPTPILSTQSDSSGTEYPVVNNTVVTDDHLRALIIITGIWVAFKEGWSHNFAYDESASTVSPRGSAGIPSPSSLRSFAFSPPVSARAHAESDELDGLSDLTLDSGTTDQPKQVSRVRRAQTVSPSSSFNALSSSSGRSSPTRRSNSVGAAFLESSNRTTAGQGSARHQRHSMFSGPHELDDKTEDGTASTKVQVQPTAKGSSGTRSRHSMLAYPSTTIDEISNTEGVGRTEVARRADEPRPAPAVGKGRIRHRLSGIFDMFSRKGTGH